MSAYSKAFRRRGETETEYLKKSWFIYESLYTELQRLSNEKYEATINDLVIVAIEDLTETENVKAFPTSNAWKVKRSFLISAELFQKLDALKAKYNISYTKLINIAINNAIEADKLTD
ncbi:MAG: hypothetical protein J6L96_03030 [Clostridia bacterium]|nr:hypothetical protein [Clostridia bacterium]